MAMKKMSAFRKPSSKHFEAFRKSSILQKSFVFTIEGRDAAGWETDVNPQSKRKTVESDAGFLQKRLRTNTLPSKGSPPKSKEKIRSRLLLKNGQYNILGKNIPQRRMRFFTDFFNTLIDLTWLSVVVLFLVSLISSWLLFALIFYVIALVNGDMDVLNTSDADRCFEHFVNFASAFLYSIETMHTIGYGHRYPTDQCGVAITVMCCSALIGCALEAFIVGVVFAKFQMPAHRAQTLMFSTNAVICLRDGQLCLLFRIGNMRKSLIIQLAVRAHLVHHRLTEEGELMPFHQHELQCKLDSMSGNAFSSWPVTACHVISVDSPIYDLNKASLARSKFEIIVTLEGVVENTGSVLQARTSYIPQEIIWGHSFTRILTFRKDKGQYIVDFNHFQTLEPVHGMLGYSAHELDENKSMSAPETVYAPEDHHIVRPPPSPGLARSLASFPSHPHPAHDGDHTNHGRGTRENSRVDLTLIADILRPPSPSLAHAVSSHTFESMQNMAKEYETNLRRISRASVDMSSHQPVLRRDSRHASADRLDRLHRSSSPPVSSRRSGAINFAIGPIEEDESEVTKF